MLKMMSHKIVGWMDHLYPRSEDEKSILEYMIEVMMEKIILLTIAFLACGLVGFFNESIICFTACMTLRSFAGGMHMKTRLACSITTTSLAVIGGLMTYYLRFPVYVCMALLVLDLILVYLYAPYVTENNPITPKFARIRKWESFVLVCIFMVLIMILEDAWRYGITIGATLATVTILPIMRKI